jgi:hypothetical protein
MAARVSVSERQVPHADEDRSLTTWGRPSFFVVCPFSACGARNFMKMVVASLWGRLPACVGLPGRLPAFSTLPLHRLRRSQFHENVVRPLWGKTVVCSAFRPDRSLTLSVRCSDPTNCDNRQKHD